MDSQPVSGECRACQSDPKWCEQCQRARKWMAGRQLGSAPAYGDQTIHVWAKKVDLEGAFPVHNPYAHTKGMRPHGSPETMVVG